jgi:D-alanine-D-alanine ligase
MDLKFPYIVKPASLGSSIGIEYAHNIEELYNCILDVFSFDEKVLVEKALKDFKEVNCSAFRYKDKIYISDIERVYSSKEFLDYEDKYNSKDGMVKCKRELPANLSEEEVELVKRYTEDVYELFDCHGVIRVDFLISNKKVYVNEINSIPGSYAFYLWESCNIRFDKLLDMVIEQCIYDFKENNKLINTFNNFKIFDSSSFKLSLK